MLDAAWKAVGGKGEMPLGSGKYSGGGVTVTVDQFTSIYVFGQYSVQNLTEGYSYDVVPKERFYGRVRLSTERGMYLCVGYESATRCGDYFLGREVITPSMRSNAWGPVGFVAVYTHAVSPKYPQGDPTAQSARLVGSPGGLFGGWSCNGVEVSLSQGDDHCYARFDLH